jgi:hypothetical protein
MSELPQNPDDPQALIDFYGTDAQVVVGRGEGMIMNLGQALEAETMFCEANDQNRQDPVKRARYLAEILARAGSLAEVHEHLLEKSE